MSQALAQIPLKKNVSQVDFRMGQESQNVTSLAQKSKVADKNLNSRPKNNFQ